MFHRSIRMLTTRALSAFPYKLSDGIKQLHFYRNFSAFENKTNRFFVANCVNSNQFLIINSFSTNGTSLKRKSEENGTRKSKRKRIISASSTSDDEVNASTQSSPT